MRKILYISGVPLYVLERDGFTVKVCNALTGEISWRDIDDLRTWGWYESYAWSFTP